MSGKKLKNIFAGIIDGDNSMPFTLDEYTNEQPVSNKDTVNSPPHYNVGNIETIDYIEAKQLGYHLGNVVKYVSRAGHKGERLEDLKKARWYLNREIDNLEADEQGDE
jgi:hypothetical protein